MPEDVVSAPDIESVYDVPLNFEKDKLSDRILHKFGLKKRKDDLRDWTAMTEKRRAVKKEVEIGIVGKYFQSGQFCFTDSYVSVIEAIKHAATFNNCKANLHWLSSEDVEKDGASSLKQYDGIIVPQGWGSRGAEGKIKTIEFCRKNKKPYFGLCYGMQMAVIEFSRNVLGYRDVNSAEVDPKTKHPVIHIMPGQAELLAKKQYGGTIRLGGWPCSLKKGTHLYKAYKAQNSDVEIVSERHRHRYEFNNEYREELEKKGLTVCGTSPDGKIVEAIEITDHPFFIGTQFHPEYISRPLNPHPLFIDFVKTCLTEKNKKKK
jgi:CTP synthase